MRTLEKADTPILTGMQIYHNYVRTHEALKGKTPAGVAGIEVKGENKWLTADSECEYEAFKNDLNCRFASYLCFSCYHTSF